MLITGPAVRLHALIVEVFQYRSCELGSLCYNLGIGIVLHTLRALALGKFKQLLNEDVLQVFNLCLVLFVNLSKDYLVLLLALTSLDGTREQFLVDYDTAE